MQTALFILYIEIVVLLLCFAAMIYVRISRYLDDKRRSDNFQQLSQIFTHSINTHQILKADDIPWRLRKVKDLLPALETFHRQFLDPLWQKSQDEIVSTLLLKPAKKFMKSFIWQNRQIGLRCVALNPKKFMEEALVVPMINDSKFLVRIVAAACMVRSERSHLLLPVIQRMVKESIMSRYPYRDLLVNGDEKVFNALEEIANISEDPEINSICLDVLATKLNHNLLHLAIKHIHSPHRSSQLASVKILGTIPGETSQQLLCTCLNSSFAEIRQEAVRGLGKIHATGCINQLSGKLNDSDWMVRLQAALALKSLGRPGRTILDTQKNSNPEAYEIAQYVLALP